MLNIFAKFREYWNFTFEQNHSEVNERDEQTNKQTRLITIPPGRGKDGEKCYSLKVETAVGQTVVDSLLTSDNTLLYLAQKYRHQSLISAEKGQPALDHSADRAESRKKRFY